MKHAVCPEVARSFRMLRRCGEIYVDYERDFIPHMREVHPEYYNRRLVIDQLHEQQLFCGFPVEIRGKISINRNIREVCAAWFNSDF